MTLINWAVPSIPTEWMTQGGAVGLLAFVALLIFFGRLVPSATYKQQLQQLERDRDYWREVALKAIGHNDILLPGAQIAVEVTRELGRQASSDVRAVERALGGAPPSDKRAS